VMAGLRAGIRPVGRNDFQLFFKFFLIPEMCPNF
jgi:hypothetical protein